MWQEWRKNKISRRVTPGTGYMAKPALHWCECWSSISLCIQQIPEYSLLWPALNPVALQIKSPMLTKPLGDSPITSTTLTKAPRFLISKYICSQNCRPSFSLSDAQTQEVSYLRHHLLLDLKGLIFKAIRTKKSYVEVNHKMLAPKPWDKFKSLTGFLNNEEASPLKQCHHAQRWAVSFTVGAQQCRMRSKNSHTSCLEGFYAGEIQRGDHSQDHAGISNTNRNANFCTRIFSPPHP